MPVATNTPKMKERPMDRPFVMFFSARDCSRCNGLMRFCAKPMIMAESPAKSGMIHAAPPSSKGIWPKNSVPGAPPSVIVWMTSTRPNRMIICTASGIKESIGW